MHGVALPHKAKREISFERKLVAARQEIDRLNRTMEQYAVAAQVAQDEPICLTRQLNSERAAAAAARDSFEAATEQILREHKAAVKEAKSQAGYNLRTYQRQMMVERKDLDEKVTRLQAIISDRDREILCHRAALRQGSKEQVKALADLEEKLEKARQGRTWDRVNQEKAKREQAEAACKLAEAEAARTQAETNKRNNSTAHQKQQLQYFERRARKLEKKVASYDIRKQKGFWEVEPMAEENDELRCELAKTEKECAELHAIVNPSASKFYSSREREDGKLIGGLRTSDDWDMLDMSLAVYNVPATNTKPVIESIAAFFGIKLPTEERTVDCRKQGVKKNITRTLVPSKQNYNENLEVGGEVADLVTYTEIAEGTSLGLTFDGATINMCAPPPALLMHTHCRGS